MQIEATLIFNCLAASEADLYSSINSPSNVYCIILLLLYSPIDKLRLLYISVYEIPHPYNNLLALFGSICNLLPIAIKDLPNSHSL